MKKYILLFVFVISLCLSNCVFANDNEELEQKLVNVGLTSSTEVDDAKLVEKLFKNQAKYANSQNLKKLEALYADNYCNCDRLSRADFFSMIKETWNLYTDIKYDNQIKNITVNGVYANVEVIETTKGKTKEKCETTKKIGNISSSSNIIYNLQKFGKTWKIISDNTLSEQTYLLYGDANTVAMNLYSPGQVASGNKYDVIFDIKVPKGYYALGSITNEPITYPQRPPKEVFRNIQQDTNLERVISANSDNHNEYAIASIGLTKPSITEDNQIHINVVGLGFLMNRVNVLPAQKGSK